MNNKTIQKAIDELKKDTPNISYVLGMLETIVELSESNITVSPGYGTGTHFPPYIVTSGTTTKEDETLNAYANGPIAPLS